MTRQQTFKLPLLVPSAMNCASCIDKLRSSVEALPGVAFVDVDPRASTLTVTHDAEALDPSALEAEARRLGYEIAGRLGHAAYRVTGLD